MEICLENQTLMTFLNEMLLNHFYYKILKILIIEICSQHIISFFIGCIPSVVDHYLYSFSLFGGKSLPVSIQWRTRIWCNCSHNFIHICCHSRCSYFVDAGHRLHQFLTYERTHRTNWTLDSNSNLLLYGSI